MPCWKENGKIGLNDMRKYIIRSKRLGFREWLDEDFKPFSKMNADPEVMKFFPKNMTANETGDLIIRTKDYFQEFGYGLYAVDKLENNEFIGFIGFMKANFEASFTPCVEIAWRIKHEEWNNGYATEGAKACLHFGFEKLQLTEIYSFTSTLNVRSEKIMQKIGMIKIGEFEHPKVEKGNKLRTHVLYKIEKPAN